MSMLHNSSLSLKEQLALRIEAELSYQMDEIIKKMQTMVKSFEIEKADKKSPFKNVLSVATETSTSLEAIKNYIRYQVGRKESSPVWKKTSKENKIFAAAVVEQLDSLAVDAESILTKVKEDISKQKENISNDNSLQLYFENGNNKKYLQKELHLKLSQLYLGYLAREHTARVGEIKSKSE